MIFGFLAPWIQFQAGIYQQAGSIHLPHIAGFCLNRVCVLISSGNGFDFDEGTSDLGCDGGKIRSGYDDTESGFFRVGPGRQKQHSQDEGHGLSRIQKDTR
jgi:hypothetical protein